MEDLKKKLNNSYALSNGGSMGNKMPKNKQIS